MCWFMMGFMTGYRFDYLRHRLHVRERRHDAALQILSSHTCAIQTLNLYLESDPVGLQQAATPPPLLRMHSCRGLRNNLMSCMHAHAAEISFAGNVITYRRIYSDKAYSNFRSVAVGPACPPRSSYVRAPASVVAPTCMQSYSG